VCGQFDVYAYMPARYCEISAMIGLNIVPMFNGNVLISGDVVYKSCLAIQGASGQGVPSGEYTVITSTGRLIRVCACRIYRVDSLCGFSIIYN